MPKPRVAQVKPCRSAPSHCSPGATTPSPQPLFAESLPPPEPEEEEEDAPVAVIGVSAPVLWAPVLPGRELEVALSLMLSPPTLPGETIALVV